MASIIEINDSRLLAVIKKETVRVLEDQLSVTQLLARLLFIVLRHVQHVQHTLLHRYDLQRFPVFLFPPSQQMLL